MDRKHVYNGAIWDPKHKGMMTSQVEKGRYLDCPDGSHIVFYSDR